MLRHQVNVLRRGCKRPTLHLVDRLKLLLGARWLPSWAAGDLLFRQVYAFFIVHVASRQVVHVAATRHPTQAWTAQQLRNATMDGDAPAVLLRDRDDKFGPAFDRTAQGVGAKVIRTAVRAPNMNAVAERFVGSARREVLDHVRLVDDQHLACLLRQYQSYFNESRPAPRARPTHTGGSCDGHRPVQADRGKSVLGGLHVDYRRAT